MNQRFAVIGHTLDESIGSGGKSWTITGRRKVVVSPMANLVNAMIPKYAAMSLFLKVTAYILRWNRTGELEDREKHGGPQGDENI